MLTSFSFRGKKYISLYKLKLSHNKFMLKTAITSNSTRGWQIHHVALRGSTKQRIAYLETEIMLRPLSTMHMSVIAAVWPRSVTGHCPVSADQIFSCISALPDSTTNPDGKKRHLYTSATWPSRVRWKTQCTTRIQCQVFCTLNKYNGFLGL